MTDIHRAAKQAGFDACYVLTCESFPHYKRRQMDGALASAGQNLVSDPGEAVPWANALLFLVTGYRPYEPAFHVSGNYPSSNLAYHRVKALVTALEADGIRAERIYVPIRELALRSGIGVECLNGLTAYDGFGTRVAVQVLAACLPGKPEYEKVRSYRHCDNCGKCISACPSHAIDEMGFHFTRCARAYMGNVAMPDWAMDCMDTLLGCETCQFVCPLNDGIPYERELPAAFDLERILKGELKPVLAIVGTNLNSGGRIIAQAIVLAVRQGRRELFPLIETHSGDERPAVRSAYAYYQRHKETE